MSFLEIKNELPSSNSDIRNQWAPRLNPHRHRSQEISHGWLLICLLFTIRAIEGVPVGDGHCWRMPVRREVPSTGGPTLVLENHARGIDSQERRGEFTWSLSMDSCGKLKFFREGKRTSTAGQLNHTMQMKWSVAEEASSLHLLEGEPERRPRSVPPTLSTSFSD
jgi:hypothetical protein